MQHVNTQICLDLATIAHHFSTSDLGSLLLTNWSPDNFVQSFKSGVVKLAHIDQALYVSEPPCSDSNQCRIEGAKRGMCGKTTEAGDCCVIIELNEFHCFVATLDK